MNKMSRLVALIPFSVILLVACGQPNIPQIGSFDGTTVEIQSTTQRASVTDQGTEVATLNSSQILKFGSRTLVVKVGKDSGRATRLNALLLKFGGTLLQDGLIPPRPGSNAPVIPNYTESVLISVNPKVVSASNLAQKMSEIGIKGNVIVSSQDAANLMFMAFSNTDVASVNQILEASQSISFPEHLQSGSYSALPPATANFLNTSAISALVTMKVATPGGAWTLRKPNTSTYLDGTGVKIAIIDIGFDTTNFDISRTDALYTTAFAPRTVWSYNFNDKNYNVNFNDGGNHGLGTSAAAGGARGNHYGTAGAAPGADLMLFRTLGGTNAIDSYLAATAVDTAVAWGANVISMSFTGWLWGGTGAFYPMNGPLQNAVNNNVIPIAAAGNDGGWFDKYPNIFNSRPFPACLSTVLTVGAHDQSLNRSVWSSSYSSNFGPGVEIYAPGGGATSLVSTPRASVCFAAPLFCTGLANNPLSPNYGFNGTSAAAPAVAGVVALMKQVNPTINLTTVRNTIRSTKQISPDAQVNADGGIVNAEAALRALGAL